MLNTCASCRSCPSRRIIYQTLQLIFIILSIQGITIILSTACKLLFKEDIKNVSEWRTTTKKPSTKVSKIRFI